MCVSFCLWLCLFVCTHCMYIRCWILIQFFTRMKNVGMEWSVFGRLDGWPARRAFVCAKKFNVMIFSKTVNMINIKLCTHWTLPIYTTYSDRACISRSQQCQTVSNENFMFYSTEVEMLYYCWLHLVDDEYTTILNLHTCSREIIDILPYLRKT